MKANDERFCPICRKWTGEPWSVHRDYEPNEDALWLEVPSDGASLVPVLRPLCRSCSDEFSVCATCRFWAGSRRIIVSASLGREEAVSSLLRVGAPCRSSSPPWKEKTSPVDMCGDFELGLFRLNAKQADMLRSTGRMAVMVPRFWTAGEG